MIRSVVETPYSKETDVPEYHQRLPVAHGIQQAGLPSCSKPYIVPHSQMPPLSGSTTQ
jgi:hypothetical protein